MCTDPVLLCLDEPAAGLNPRETEELNDLLLRIRDGGCSILLIEHDMGVVMRISDHIVVLDHGKKIADGPPAEVRSRSDGDRRLSRRGRRGRELDGGGRRSEAAESLLRLAGVTAYYGAIQALKGVDLDVNEGEIVTLIGANGAGKSTLMMTICGSPAARDGDDPLRRRGHHASADPRDHAPAHLPGAGGTADLSAHDGVREPADGRRGHRAEGPRHASSSRCSRCSPACASG